MRRPSDRSSPLRQGANNQLSLPGLQPTLGRLRKLACPAIHAASMRAYWLYILVSRPRGTLYVGVTSNLVRRVYEHQNEAADGFTKQYGVKMLVYYER